jgi:hypothetical protein
MSNYVQSTNFATKDALSSGDPLKIVKGTEINTEFNNIATAVATKADLASPTFSGTPSLPTGTTAVTQGSGNNTTAVATTAFVQAAATAVLQLLHPVGSVYINATNSTNPGTLLGFGTWSAFGAGRVPVGFNAADPLFDTAEETGGSKDAIVVSHTHTATVTDPGHFHTTNIGKFDNLTADNFTAGRNTLEDGNFPSGTKAYDTNSKTTGISVSNSTAGSSGTNANLQPYITVFMWKRTA